MNDSMSILLQYSCKFLAIAKTPPYFSALIFFKLIFKSLLALPSASQKIYSSIIVSPIINIFLFFKFSSLFLIISKDG